MKRKMAVLLVGMMSFGITAHAQDSAPLHLVQTITLDAAVQGKFDHMAVDIAGGRVFLTAPQHHSVQVFDFKSGKWMDTVTGLGKPAGSVYLPETNQGLGSVEGPGKGSVIVGSTD